MSRKIKPPTLLNINLKKIREAKGLTQKEVALALGMKNYKMISWYENTGAMPPYKKLMALIKFYEISSVDELFGVPMRPKRQIKKDNIYFLMEVERKINEWQNSESEQDQLRAQTMINILQHPKTLDYFDQLFKALKNIKKRGIFNDK